MTRRANGFCCHGSWEPDKLKLTPCSALEGVPTVRSVPCFLCILAVVLCNGLALAQEPRRIELVVQKGGGMDMTLSGDGKYVFSGGSLWEAASGKTLRTFPYRERFGA